MDIRLFTLSIISPLSFGIRDLTMVLLFCDATCLTCLGPFNNQCTTCEENFYLSKNECLCKEGFYLFNSPNTGEVKDSFPKSQCRMCHETCKNCNGPSQKDCLECKEGFEKIEGKCTFKGNIIILLFFNCFF